MTKTMTMREFLTAVIELENVPTELQDYATERIMKLDEANEKKKNAPKKNSKASESNATYFETVKDFLTTQDEPVPAKVIAEHLELTTQKVTAILKLMINEDMVVKVDGKTKSKPFTYKLG